MHFTVNTAFVNYLDSLDILTETLKFPILHNCISHQQTLPFSLQSFEFDSDLLKTTKMLKDFEHLFQHNKNFLIFKKGIIYNGLD